MPPAEVVGWLLGHNNRRRSTIVACLWSIRADHGAGKVAIVDDVQNSISDAARLQRWGDLWTWIIVPRKNERQAQMKREPRWACAKTSATVEGKAPALLHIIITCMITACPTRAPPGHLDPVAFPMTRPTTSRQRTIGLDSASLCHSSASDCNECISISRGVIVRRRGEARDMWTCSGSPRFYEL